MNEPLSKSGGGLRFAVAAHVFWGAMPLYLLLVKDVPPPLEFIAWRVLFTLPLCLAVLAVTNGWSELHGVMRDRRAMRTLVASATLIGINWFVYVWAIQHGQVYAASLGYYVTPLLMMLLGMVALGERLNRWQWLAVGLAAIGVGALVAGALTTLWLSLALAASFGTYGLLRKMVAAGALAGLTVETLILYPPALGIIAWYAASPAGSALTQSWGQGLSVALSGPMTAFPLMWFAVAARRMPYTMIGFLQFIAPTLVFVIGLTVFHAALKPAQLACYIAIWAAAAVFAWDLVRTRVSEAEPA